jgi:hypothetical protein
MRPMLHERNNWWGFFKSKVITREERAALIRDLP